MTSPRSTPPPASSGAAYPAADAPCPCGSGRSFGQCCGPLLQHQQPASSAEQLMRSRFTAHAIGDYRHLHRSYLATASQPYVEEREASDFKWTRLVIQAHEPGAKPDVAFVDFTAYYDHGGTEHPLHEKSEFLRQNGTWFYSRTVRQGPAPVKSTAPKIGRNDPCSCGSGKKYKHCCGR